VALQKGRITRRSGQVVVGAQVLSDLSTTRVTTTSATAVDDTEAILTFTLKYDSYIFILYNVSSENGSVETRAKWGLINIDDSDSQESRADQRPGYSDRANSFTSMFVGELSKGSHTVKGRFAAMVAGDTVGIDCRQLIVLAIPQVLKGFIGGVMSTVRVETTSGTLVDDTESVYSVDSTDLPEDMESVLLYQASSPSPGPEIASGKYGLINVDGTDKVTSRAEQAPECDDAPNSFTSLHAQSLTAGSHTFKGRFASNTVTWTVGINNRQLCLIC